MRTIARVAKLARILAHAEHRAALRYGIAASVELDGIPFSSGIRTVIDAGANRGQFAAFALRRFPEATIHSFEPLPGPADRLARYAGERGQGRIVLHRVALAASDGRATVHVANEDDSSSLLPFGAAQLRLGTRPVSEVEVETRRLDAVLGPSVIVHPCLLKIDVQGYELEVLRGATGLLDLMDEILVECSRVPFYVGQPLEEEFVAFLRERGFARLHVHPSITTSAGVMQADLLFGR